jgi:hypothetical protein
VNNLTDYVKKLNNNSALKNLLRDKGKNKFVNTKIIFAKIIKMYWLENKLLVISCWRWLLALVSCGRTSMLQTTHKVFAFAKANSQ